LKNALSLFATPAASTASPNPSPVNSRIACGKIVMPTPSALISGAIS